MSIVKIDGAICKDSFEPLTKQDHVEWTDFFFTQVPSLKLTFSPLKIGLPNRKVVFQPSILGAMLVSGRVHFLRLRYTP